MNQLHYKFENSLLKLIESPQKKQKDKEAEYRIIYYDRKVVRFSYKHYAEGAKTRYMTLKVNTFIGRLIRHIPDKHFPMIRYVGLFSNRWKKRYLSQAHIALKQSELDDSPKDPSTSWTQRQGDYPGINPLICPDCDQLLTLVGTFFGDWNKLQSVFHQAGKEVIIPSCLLRAG